ncbi:BTB/POZ domain-containing protein 6, partial [Stegodyphus mimosarum]
METDLITVCKEIDTSQSSVTCDTEPISIGEWVSLTDCTEESESENAAVPEPVIPEEMEPLSFAESLLFSVGNVESLSIENYEQLSIVKAIATLWKANLYTDVHFTVKGNFGEKNYFAHRLVLSIFSPFFADKFCNPDVKIDNTIKIPDVSPTAFEAMLRFMYGDSEAFQSMIKNLNILLDVYKLALRYKIESLRKKCIQSISSASPTKSNVFVLLEAAQYVKSDSLKLRCYKVIQTQTSEIFKSYDVGTIPPHVLSVILDRPELSLASEFELLDWAYTWAKNRCLFEGKDNAREIMQPLLPKLNFLTLSYKELAEFIRKHPDFFTESEALSLFMNISGSEWPLPSWCAG